MIHDYTMHYPMHCSCCAVAVHCVIPLGRARGVLENAHREQCMVTDVSNALRTRIIIGCASNACRMCNGYALVSAARPMRAGRLLDSH